jgi:hypothetical protein
MDQAIYERTARRQQVVIRVLRVVLLALVARTVIDGRSVVGG